MRTLRWAVGIVALHATFARAQTSADVPLGQRRTVSGSVLRPGTGAAPGPVAGQLVVLHRVGQDRAGPLDSTRTGARGKYHFTYKTSGTADAVYFASATYGGIAYFTAPLQEVNVGGDEGDITVYDTTSHGIALHLAGQHIVIGTTRTNGAHDVAEVFDLANDASKTLIARDSVTPLWTAMLPEGAIAPTVSGGDIAAGAVVFAGRQVRLFAPISPGVRQLAIAFGLPASAFPLTLSMRDTVAALELLVQDASTEPTMAHLVQQSSVTEQGVPFKRYLASDVPPATSLRIDVASLSDTSRTRFLAGITFAMAVIMA
ncbi:MAG TPA: hypothetical protein VIJ16_10020, partial [Gemmatimonadaceae bacterium]